MYSLFRRVSGRRALGLGLALVLALTSHSLADMRNMPDPVGRMVLCTGNGPVSVLVDADGRPAAPPRFCPDCVIALFAVLVPPPAQIVLRRREGRAGILPVSVAAGRSRAFAALARAPPLPV